MKGQGQKIGNRTKVMKGQGQKVGNRTKVMKGQGHDLDYNGRSKGLYDKRL